MISGIPEDRSKDAWLAATWKQEWEASGPTRVHRHVSDPGEGVKGEELSRKHWTTLNRLRTGVGRYRASMKTWGLADSAACECGEPEQTADHIINRCPLHRPPSEAGLFEVGPLTSAWLQHTELNIGDDDIRKKKKKDQITGGETGSCFSLPCYKVSKSESIERCVLFHIQPLLPTMYIMCDRACTIVPMNFHWH